LPTGTRAGELLTTASVYQSIVTLGNSINDMFINQPELHREIFGPTADFTAPNAEQEQCEHPRRFYAALKWLDYFETVLVSWPAIPDNLREPWKACIRDSFANSPYMSRFVLETPWFGDDLVRLCREAQQHKPPSPTVTSA
jgi:hypothetical protein